MQTTISSLHPIAAELPPLDEPARPDTVASCLSPRATKVPSWFTIGAALRVAECKGVEHLLVIDRGAVVGTVAARAMRAAPAGDPLARWMSSAAALSPETPRIEAARLMATLGVDCLPVTSGVLLVGLVTRAELAVRAQRPAG